MHGRVNGFPAYLLYDIHGCSMFFIVVVCSAWPKYVLVAVEVFHGCDMS